MNDSYPQRFIDGVNQYGGYTFAQYMVEKYPPSTLCMIDDVISQAWDDYLDPTCFAWSRMRFTSLIRQLAIVNNLRPYADNNKDALALCDAVEKHLVTLFQKIIEPNCFEPNWLDSSYARVLRDYCLSQEADDSPSRAMGSEYWDETQFQNAKKTILPHLTTPFIFMLLRYTYYHTIVDKMAVDVAYRRSIGVNSKFNFDQVTKVNWGKHSQREVCEHYITTSIGGALYEIPEAYSFCGKPEDIPHEWLITLLETEGQRLRQDYSYLQKHFNRRFVASLMEWHKFYFDYLVECLHNCEEYKDYPIEKLVPQNKVATIKPRIIDENRALTPLGKSCRRAVVAKIQECKTAADYGALLYKFQYESNFFTKNRLSRNEYYLFMQQIGKVTFGSSGDFSNCNKGFYQAAKEASK